MKGSMANSHGGRSLVKISERRQSNIMDDPGSKLLICHCFIALTGFLPRVA
jgi:hypothetical protein